MKVAVISTPLMSSPPPTYGGLERITYHLAYALNELGVEASLIAAKGSRLENGELIETIEPPYRVDVDWFGLEKKAYEAYRDRLEEFDVIHDHSWYMFSYLYKRDINPGIKVLHTHHSFANFRTLPVSKPNFVGLSKWHSYVLSRQVPGSIWRYVYNGIEVDEYEYTGDKEDFYIWLGRISRIKAPDVAIEVARKADVKLYVLGGDKFVDDMNYVRYIKNLCDGRQIIYLGEQPRDKVMEYLSRAKALLFTNDPTRWFGEPFGLVPIEAMAVGTPVIALNSGATYEVVNHGRTGYVVQSPIDMVDVVKSGLIEEIKPVDCRRWVERNFSRYVMARNYLNLYRDVLEDKEW